MHPEFQQNIAKKNQCSQALICSSSSTTAPSMVRGVLAKASAPSLPRPAAGMPPGVAIRPRRRQLPVQTPPVTANRPPTEPQQADTRLHRHHSGAGRPATVPGARNRLVSPLLPSQAEEPAIPVSCRRIGLGRASQHLSACAAGHQPHPKSPHPATTATSQHTHRDTHNSQETQRSERTQPWQAAAAQTE